MQCPVVLAEKNDVICYGQNVLDRKSVTKWDFLQVMTWMVSQSVSTTSKNPMSTLQPYAYQFSSISMHRPGVCQTNCYLSISTSDISLIGPISEMSLVFYWKILYSMSGVAGDVGDITSFCYGFH